MESQTLESLLRQYITNSVNGIFTSMPGRVIKVVDAGEQRVDVQPLVSRVKPDESLLEHPVILSVPLVYPGSRSSQFSFPVEVGDTVLLVFSQRSIQRFKQGAETPHRPINLAKYSRNDAMAVPGLFSFPSAVNNPSKRTLSHDTTDAVVTHNIGTAQECEIRLKASGDVIINSPGKTVVNTDTAEINASSSVTVDSPSTTVTGQLLVQGALTYQSGLTGTGSANITGDVIADGISLKNHTHSQPSDGAGDSESETNPPTV